MTNFIPKYFVLYYCRKANKEVLQQHRTQDEINKSEMDKDRSASDKIRNMEKENFELNREKRIVISYPVESKEKVRGFSCVFIRKCHEQVVKLLL